MPWAGYWVGPDFLFSLKRFGSVMETSIKRWRRSNPRKKHPRIEDHDEVEPELIKVFRERSGLFAVYVFFLSSMEPAAPMSEIAAERIKAHTKVPVNSLIHPSSACESERQETRPQPPAKDIR